MNNIKLFIKKVSINFRPQFVQEGLKSNTPHMKKAIFKIRGDYMLSDL